MSTVVIAGFLSRTSFVLATLTAIHLIVTAALSPTSPALNSIYANPDFALDWSWMDDGEGDGDGEDDDMARDTLSLPEHSYETTTTRCETLEQVGILHRRRHLKRLIIT
ncbi:unnamed protein product [Angiostrongylus costaricensis]|uniref:Secreted protein n=1 Tax=Angiostrongylus costaricensis TaxID=334426 RepID=A0A0R3PPW5_ANGCS|nr:unnamed protein product [Angiostrongylus costaricensis]